MKEKILPLDLRVKIMEMMDQGHSNDSIFSLILPEARKFVTSEKQLAKCIASIRIHHDKGHRPN